MDQADALGLLRDLMKLVGASLVTHGVVAGATWELITGIAIAALPIIWSHLKRQQVKAAIIDSAATGVPIMPSVAAPLSPISAPAVAAGAKLSEYAIIIALALALAGCSLGAQTTGGTGGVITVGPAPAVDPAPLFTGNIAADAINLPQTLGKFTANDFAIADKIALAQGDKAGDQCYAYLGPLVAKLPGLLPTFDHIPGVVEAFENLRVGIRGSGTSGGLIEDINLHCAALFVDAKVTIGKLALLGAGGAGTGAALVPVIGGLPAILGGLPIPLAKRPDAVP